MPCRIPPRSTLDSSARVRHHIIEVLAGGPLPFESLCAALIERGLTLGPDPHERMGAVMGYMDDVACLTVRNPHDDGKWVDVVYLRTALLDGTTWTVPVNELDIASDTLSADDLGLLFGALINGRVRVVDTDGVHLDDAHRRQTVANGSGQRSTHALGVVFPRRWLSAVGATPGGHLQFHVEGETARVEAITSAPSPTNEMIDMLIEATVSVMGLRTRK